MGLQCYLISLPDPWEKQAWIWVAGRKANAALAPRSSQGPHPTAMLEDPGMAPFPRENDFPFIFFFYFRSFWLRKPSFIFSTTLASIELASLAKSRSRISDTGTETMANASLSSLVGHVPSWEGTEKQCHTGRAVLSVTISCNPPR